MKILYLITQSEIGGAQLYVYDLAKKFKDEHEVVVAFGEQGESGNLTKLLKNANIKYFAIPHLKRSILPWYDFLALFQIANLIIREKPDIIHLNSSKISILGSLACFITKFYFNPKFNINETKIIYTVHGWVFNEPLPLWKKLFYKYTEKFTAHLKNKLICVSKYDCKIARDEKIAIPNKLIPIHNGREKVEFLSKKTARKKLFKELKNDFSINDDEILLGAIGNLYNTKGYEFFINAVSRLIIEGIKVKAIVIGKGPEYKKLKKIIKAHRLNKYFFLAGRKGGPQWLKAFDIYVCSSVKEGLSYTIIEAMQAELPIIATNVGGNPELIENNKEGLLIHAKKPDELAKKIQELINDPEKCKKLGINAKEKALSNFSYEQMIDKTREVYLGK